MWSRSRLRRAGRASSINLRNARPRIVLPYESALWRVLLPAVTAMRSDTSAGNDSTETEEMSAGCRGHLRNPAGLPQLRPAPGYWSSVMKPGRLHSMKRLPGE